MMIGAVWIGIAGSVGGLYLSYYGGLAAGASIALVLVGGYLAAMVFRAIPRSRSPARNRTSRAARS